MPGFVLTQATTAMCPHGGQVSFMPSQLEMKADGSPILLMTDPALIAGCGFSISGAPAPCLMVQWITASTQFTVNATPVPLNTSIGLCTGVGPPVPVMVVAFQTRMTAT